MLFFYIDDLFIYFIFLKKKQAPSVEKTQIFYVNYDVIKCICNGLNKRPEDGWKKIAGLY